MTDDQFFQLVALLAIAFFIAGGALPLTPTQRRLARQGAVAVLVVGLGAALVKLATGW
jgi:hypothetical protein